jgi:hypothetical protein
MFYVFNIDKAMFLVNYYTSLSFRLNFLFNLLIIAIRI